MINQRLYILLKDPTFTTFENFYEALLTFFDTLPHPHKIRTPHRTYVETQLFLHAL